MGVNTRLRKLKNFVVGLGQAVSVVTSRINAVESDVSQMVEIVNSHRRDQVKAEEDLADRVHAIGVVQHQLVARVDTLRNAHPPYSMRVEKLEDQIQGLSTWTSATVDEQNRLDTQVKSHADAIERNRVQASYLDEQEQSLRGSVLTLIGRVEKLENDTERVLSTATGDALRFKQLDVLLPTIHDRLLTLEAFRAEVRWRGVLETDAETDEGTEIADIEEYEERL